MKPRPVDGTITIVVKEGSFGNVDISSNVTGDLSLFEVIGVLETAKDQMINAKREDAFYAHLPKPEGT